MCVAGVIAMAPRDAVAQFVDEVRERTVAPGSATNLFFSWEGVVPMRGTEVTLPAGWSLTRVDVVRNGFERLPLQIDRVEGDDVHYRILLAEPLARFFVYAAYALVSMGSRLK